MGWTIANLRGFLGYDSMHLKKQPNDKNGNIGNIDADYKEISKTHSKIEQYYFWCLFR